ncbi:GMC family oxidoreductase [Porticoccaceae bacterium]|nr:GMC family oxidoreductase [Porticoccaceae bacterium]
MLFDFNVDTSISKHYDVCIVGTGPAGITLSRKLAKSGQSVVLLEAGGLEYSEASQEFYECESIGHNAWPKFTRLRYFGGTSNHWSGRCRPFESSDFEAPTINGLPGWPISYTEIEPYLKEAMEIVDLDSDQGFQPLHAPLLGKSFNSDAFAKSPPTRFREKYLSEIEHQKNIDCFYNATAIDLSLDKSHQFATKITLSNVHNHHSTVPASKFILCLGGIETPRFLLNCNTQIKDGIGNSNDMVGRCFMEHLNVPMGSFLYKDTEQYSNLQFFAADEFRSNNGIGKSNITMGIVKRIRSYGRTKAIKNFFKNIACQSNIEDKVQFISNFKCPGMGSIGTLIEQSPNLNSRVTLSKAKDNFGQNKARLDWQISPYDETTIRRTAIALAKEFNEAGLGTIRVADFILDETIDIQYSHHSHHMGTTRMSNSDKKGVVDRNCKVHGVDNLYIAGSSVFATGGACNPTMPIIQLCLRLAKHIA